MEELWEHAFESKPIKEHEKADCDKVRACFIQMAHDLQGLLPPGRYRALVKTKLEETAMFATKSFSHGS